MNFGITFPPDERGERLLDDSYTNYVLIELAENTELADNSLTALFSHRGLRYMYDKGIITTNPVSSDPSVHYLYFVQMGIKSTGNFGMRKLAIFSNSVDTSGAIGDYGITIKNSGGKIVYDSRLSFLRVSGFVNGPGLDDLSWSSYTTTNLTGVSVNSNTFILGNPYMHPFFHQVVNVNNVPTPYINSVDFIFVPPEFNQYDSITLRMKKTSRKLTHTPVSGYNRGLQYYTSCPIILADLGNLI